METPKTTWEFPEHSAKAVLITHRDAFGKETQIWMEGPEAVAMAQEILNR